jgi:stage II sporulation protein P
MNRIRYLYFLSIAALIFGGFLFVKAHRYENTVKIIEDLKSKSIIIYSSNFRRLYIDSRDGGIKDMEKLCMEGSNIIKNSGLDCTFLKILDGNEDPYTLSGIYIDKYLNKNNKYILIDISRNQSRRGEKYNVGQSKCSSISIILSRKSKSYDDSLLFAGRVKSIIDKKYDILPVQIIHTDSDDYNQSKGYISMLVEIGDAANTYDEAMQSLKIFSEALIEVIDAKE